MNSPFFKVFQNNAQSKAWDGAIKSYLLTITIYSLIILSEQNFW